MTEEKNRRRRTKKSTKQLLEANLEKFLEANAWSSIEEADSGSSTSLKIFAPWNDTSLILEVPQNSAPLVKALNDVILPERFTAIWHRESRSLEVIWTAFRLSESQKEIDGRKFTFEHRGKPHECEFKASSPELLAIASAFVPVTMSETNHRNLQSFKSYTAPAPAAGPPTNLDCPRSFWISNIDWKEKEAPIIELVRSLNFYMTYFDVASPQIVIHPPAPAKPQARPAKRTRYIRENFPAEIIGATLDENLMSFWEFAHTGNPMMRFLLYFRIIEYGASHYIDDTIRSEIKRVLLLPDIRSRTHLGIEQVIAATAKSKLQDSQRLHLIVRNCVSPELIWRDVKANVSFFSKDTKFDGGFTVPPIVSEKDTQETFCSKGLETFANRLKQIRNALSHGKDLETAGVIRPTSTNFRLMQPWVHLIAITAGEVVLNKDHT